MLSNRNVFEIVSRKWNIWFRHQVLLELIREGSVKLNNHICKESDNDWDIKYEKLWIIKGSYNEIKIIENNWGR